MDSPLVSVIIPTFNAAGLLPATIASVLDQTYTNVEILVIDDGSTDATPKVLECFGNRIRYFRQENWGGPSGPRNVGVKNATGDLIAIFDSDDLMMPEKLATAVDVFRHNPDVNFTFSNFQGIDEEGEVHRDDFLSKYRSFRRVLQREEGSSVGVIPGRMAYRELLTANFIGTSSVVCRREVFDRVGLFDESMLNADDVDMWRRIAYAGFSFAYIDKVLHSYRKTAGGVTARGAQRYPAILVGLRKQVKLDLEPDEQKILARKIYQMQLGYGIALCKSGDYRLSRSVFLGALKSHWSFGGAKGLVKSIFLQLFVGKKNN